MIVDRLAEVGLHAVQIRRRLRDGWPRAAAHERCLRAAAVVVRDRRIPIAVGVVELLEVGRARVDAVDRVSRVALAEFLEGLRHELHDALRTLRAGLAAVGLLACVLDREQHFGRDALTLRRLHGVGVEAHVVELQRLPLGEAHVGDRLRARRQRPRRGVAELRTEHAGHQAQPERHWVKRIERVGDLVIPAGLQDRLLRKRLTDQATLAHRHAFRRPGERRGPAHGHDDRHAGHRARDSTRFRARGQVDALLLEPIGLGESDIAGQRQRSGRAQRQAVADRLCHEVAEPGHYLRADVRRRRVRHDVFRPGSERIADVVAVARADIDQFAPCGLGLLLLLVGQRRDAVHGLGVRAEHVSECAGDLGPEREALGDAAADALERCLRQIAEGEGRRLRRCDAQPLVLVVERLVGAGLEHAVDHGPTLMVMR